MKVAPGLFVFLATASYLSATRVALVRLIPPNKEKNKSCDTVTKTGGQRSLLFSCLDSATNI